MAHAGLHMICPHCNGENPAFGEQRCSHCGISMMSDQQHRQRQEIILPLIEQLTQIEQENISSDVQRYQQVQPLLDQLAPYASQHEFLASWLKQQGEQWLPVMQRLFRFRQMLMLHLFFLFLLCLVPLVAWLMGAGPMLMGLLCLPVFGWGYLGVWGFVQRFQSQSSRGENQK